MSTSLDLHDPLTYASGFPHDEFTRLRAEAPIFHQPHRVWPTGYWNIVRHRDIQQVSRDSSTFSTQPSPFFAGSGDESDQSSGLLISLDQPEHTKKRKLINRGFTPRRVRELETSVQATVDRLLDEVGPRGECDLVRDVAIELPLQVIADLVGVPPEDRHRIFELTETTFGFDPELPDDAQMLAAMEMYAYADAMCELRREKPTDDLITVLLQAEIDGESLTQFEIDLFFLLLQNAGSETTRNLITSGAVAMLEAPDQLELLRSDMDTHLDNAIEELLRFVSPVMQFLRRPLVDVEIAGQRIPAGDPVVLWYPSANRDETVFDDPHRVDITRNTADHVAFGAGGPHFCLGASLARLELQIMFRELFSRLDGLELAVDSATLPRVHSELIDGLATLPVRWTDYRPRTERVS